MAALTAVGAYLHFPLGEVPFSMQPFFVYLTGFVLGPAFGAAAMGLYLAAGLIGLPVFAGGASGLGVLMGPTGGFLVGFVITAAICGLASRRSFTWVKGAGWGLLGMAVLFALGVAQLKMVTGFTWGKAAAVGVLPFILPEFAKLAAAILVYRFMAARRLLPA